MAELGDAWTHGNLASFFFHDDNIIPLKKGIKTIHASVPLPKRALPIFTRSTIYKGASLSTHLKSGIYETNHRWYILDRNNLRDMSWHVACGNLVNLLQAKTRETAGDARQMRAD